MFRSISGDPSSSNAATTAIDKLIDRIARHVAESTSTSNDLLKRPLTTTGALFDPRSMLVQFLETPGSTSSRRLRGCAKETLTGTQIPGIAMETDVGD